MRTPLILAGPLALSLVHCTEPPPATPPPATPAPPPVMALAAPTPAPSVAQTTFDTIARLDFNRIAAELALPLFWVEDANGSGAVDPEEVATLWGLTPAPPAWTEGGRFTPAFITAYAAMAKVKAEGYPTAGMTEAEKKRRAAVRAELAQGRTALIRSDFRAAKEEDRAIVAHVLKAAELIEQIYAKQRGTAGMMAEIPPDDLASRALFHRNQGPWCEAPKTEKDPDCNALPRKPPKISGMYPASLQKDPKFCEALEARKDQKTLLDTFSIVTEAGGELKAIPYNVAYKAEMEAISRELKAAAEAIKSPEEAPFKAYLTAAAQSFLDNNWVPADEAWAKMNVNNSKYYLRVAPDEVYFEPCSHKAGFHATFARINQASLSWQKKLEPVKTEMEATLARLAGPPYKARNVTFHLPDFIDIIINAGDDRNALGATIGQSLPNLGPVASEGRGRTVAMTNLYTDKDSEAAFKEQTESLFCKATIDMMAFAPSIMTMSTVLHEAAHNLGPAHEYKANGKTDKEAFGGPLASTLEELKAQTSALFLADWLADKGIIDKQTAMKAHARDVAWAFGHISEGMTTSEGTPKPYSQLSAIQVGALLKAGAITWRAEETAANGKDKGCFALSLDRFPAAVRDLEKTVLGIKARGDKAGAIKLRQELVDNDGEWMKLRGIITERWLRAPRASFVYAVER